MGVTFWKLRQSRFTSVKVDVTPVNGVDWPIYTIIKNSYNHSTINILARL